MPGQTSGSCHPDRQAGSPGVERSSSSEEQRYSVCSLLLCPGREQGDAAVKRDVVFVMKGANPFSKMCQKLHVGPG